MNGPSDILFDVTRPVARAWSGRPPNGIDRVADAYLEHFAPVARAVVQHRGVVLTLTRSDSARLYAILQRCFAGGFRQQLVRLVPGALWRSTVAPIAPGALYINVTHTDFDLPRHWEWVRRNRLRAVYMIHDLIPLEHPEYCRPHAIARHRARVEAALTHACGIVANSQATADSLASYATQHRYAAPPVLAALLGGGALDRAPAQPSASLPYGLTAGGYVLCVGTIEPRKNHALLLDVWHQLAAQQAGLPRLVLVGKWGALSDALKHRIANDTLLTANVRVLSDVSDDQLGPLMAGALGMVQPSLAEGFGLPLCEALATGTPVIASDLPSHRELAQGQAVLVDPQDRAGWIKAIAALIGRPITPEAREAAARGYAMPTWTEHFHKLDDWLARLKG